MFSIPPWYHDMILGCCLIGNNFWNSYFRKIYQIFFQIFLYGKYTIKISIFLWICFWKNWWNNIWPISRDFKIMSRYQGGILSTWHVFQISKNRQYIVSSGFWKTNSNKYTDFYCIFSIQKNLKKIRYIFLNFEFQKLLSIKQHPKIMSCYQGSTLNTWQWFSNLAK